MRYEKPPFCIFSIHILNFTFLSLIVFSILDNTDLLTTFPFGNKDGTTSDLSIYCKLPLRRCCFSSWLSSNESLVKWSEDPWIALGKTGLAIALIQASYISFLSRPDILWYETFLSNLDWFEQPFTVHIKWPILFHQKFPLLSYDLNTVSLNDKFLENNFQKFRSSNLQLFFTISVLKNFVIFTGKHLCWGLLLIKLQAWRSAALFKKRLYHSCFLVNITKFLGAAFCMEHLQRLLLKMVEFLINSILIRGICTEEFIRNSSSCFNSLRKVFVQKNCKKL